MSLKQKTCPYVLMSLKHVLMSSKQKTCPHVLMSSKQKNMSLCSYVFKTCPHVQHSDLVI